MLMSQSFVDLLQLWDKDCLPNIDNELVRDHIPLLLFQALSRTLQSQHPSGFWGRNDSGEETAYALLTIAALSVLPFARPLEEEIGIAIHNGRRALRVHLESKTGFEHLWIEKISYGSPTLHQAYILAALNATSKLTRPTWNRLTIEPVNMAKVAKFVPFYQNLLTVGALPAWRIRISLMEGCLFGPLVSKVRFEVFPPRSLGDKEETYWDNIRFTWCCVNSINLTFASADFIVNWMTISYINYQADEYMEAVVATRFSHDWDAVAALIEDAFIFEGSEIDPRQTVRLRKDTGCETSPKIGDTLGITKNGYPTTPGSESPQTEKDQKFQDEVDLQEIRRVFQRLNEWTFTHPQVVKASLYHLKETKHEMKMWMLGHLIQAIDSRRLAYQRTYLPFETPTTNFHHWVSHVSADHTSVRSSSLQVDLIIRQVCHGDFRFLAQSRLQCLLGILFQFLT
jgi:hypothetical protein